MDDFVIRALAAGIGVALVAGPLGSFVVWWRMDYFGDALSHSALLGVGLGFLIGIRPSFGIVAVCIALALLLVLLQRQKTLASDTLLGIMAHSALSLGLVVIAFMETLRVDVMAYLFGDVLAVTADEIGWIYATAMLSLALLVAIWRPLLSITVHEELARVEGVRVTLVRLLFMCLIAVVIAAAMKVVGVLLITSLMIIPAATARHFAKTPEQMAIIAAVIGCLAVLGGIEGSLRFDTPTGPSVVVAAVGLFVASLLLPLLRSFRSA
ncbi:MAG TPA: zinc ABC transporter permease subunit ZnuB [Sneathiellales bacterium]|nr:zinc ABC transporter permease subunit ZnuB [Sneathiellales bacterium]